MRRTRLAVGVAAATMLLVLSTGAVAMAASGGTGGILAGPTWVLKSYASGGLMTDVPSAVYADAVFEDGQKGGAVNGSAGCNVFNGSYTSNGAALTIGPLATTMMACEAPQSTVETAYLAALGNAATYTATAATLTIYDAAGTEILRYDAGSPSAITGMTWHLRGYNNGKQAVVGVIGDTDPTAVFGTDGQVSGNATCNTYFGGYTTTGSAIQIGPLGSTLMACPEQEQETAYLAALQNATTYQVQGPNLEMRDASGAIQVMFSGVAAEPLPTTAPASAEPSTASTGTEQPTAPPTSTSGSAPGGGVPLGSLLLVAGAFLVTALVVPIRRLRDR
ncbi:MAG: META domain-containing protein [Chloroflexota bacterium]